jgi:hypothetical protein
MVRIVGRGTPWCKTKVFGSVAYGLSLNEFALEGAVARG